MEENNLDRHQLSLIMMKLNELAPSLKKSMTLMTDLSQILDTMLNSHVGYYSSKEACFILNISTRTLQKYRDSGQISYEIYGRTAYHLKSDVDNFIAVRNRKRTEIKRKREFNKTMELSRKESLDAINHFSLGCN